MSLDAGVENTNLIKSSYFLVYSFSVLIVKSLNYPIRMLLFPTFMVFFPFLTFSGAIIATIT